MNVDLLLFADTSFIYISCNVVLFKNNFEMHYQSILMYVITNLSLKRSCCPVMGSCEISADEIMNTHLYNLNYS